MSQYLTSADTLHIFYVQSYISFFVCCGIVEARGIAPGNVIFMLDRGFAPKTDYAVLATPPEFRSGPSKTWKGIPWSRTNRTNSKKFLSDLAAGRRFEFYVNRMNHEFLDAVRSVDACTAINLYEEGLAAYYRRPNDGTPDNEAGLSPDYNRTPKKNITGLRSAWTDTKQSIARRLSGYPWHRNRLSFYDESYGFAYAAGDQAFLGFPRRRKVDLPAAIASYDTGNAYVDLPENSIIFVMPQVNPLQTDDAYINRFVGTLSNAIQAAAGARYIVFQLHPDLCTGESAWVPICDRVREKTGLEMRERLIRNYPLEVVAMRRPDIGFFVIMSSAALYAKQF